MKTRTEICTEYAPFRKTASGIWRPLTVARYRSKLEAERYIERELSLPHADAPENYKIMQRTVITTLSEWEDLAATQKETE